MIKHNLYHFLQKWIQPVFPIQKLYHSIPLYFRYLRDWQKYSSMLDAEILHFSNSYPCLFDRTETTPFDKHYVYQSIWAAKLIFQSNIPHHVDIGSHVLYVGMLTAMTSVTYIDIRPIVVDLNNFTSQFGSILDLPFASNSIPSLSCLHVAEHVGLGRYGDPLNPLGTIQAASELARVLAPGGHLYFSLPIGQPQICFNAHRIHATSQVLSYFKSLKLLEFSCVLDNGTFLQNVEPVVAQSENYACGLFHFTKGLL